MVVVVRPEEGLQVAIVGVEAGADCGTANLPRAAVLDAADLA